MITASRLDPRKPSIWPFGVVAQAQKRLPALQLIFMGKGGGGQLATPDSGVGSARLLFIYVVIRDLKQIYPAPLPPHHFSVGDNLDDGT